MEFFLFKVSVDIRMVAIDAGKADKCYERRPQTSLRILLLQIVRNDEINRFTQRRCVFGLGYIIDEGSNYYSESVGACTKVKSRSSYKFLPMFEC